VTIFGSTLPVTLMPPLPPPLRATRLLSPTLVGDELASLLVCLLVSLLFGGGCTLPPPSLPPSSDPPLIVDREPPLPLPHFFSSFSTPTATLPTSRLPCASSLSRLFLLLLFFLFLHYCVLCKPLVVSLLPPSPSTLCSLLLVLVLVLVLRLMIVMQLFTSRRQAPPPSLCPCSRTHPPNSALSPRSLLSIVLRYTIRASLSLTCRILSRP